MKTTSSLKNYRCVENEISLWNLNRFYEFIESRLWNLKSIIKDASPIASLKAQHDELIFVLKEINLKRRKNGN